MKYTSGPWRVARQNPGPTTGEWMIAGAKPGYLAEVRDCGSGDVEANARLIAAAPELLDALRRIADGQEMTGDFSHADTVAHYQKIASAAIAQAV